MYSKHTESMFSDSSLNGSQFVGKMGTLFQQAFSYNQAMYKVQAHKAYFLCFISYGQKLTTIKTHFCLFGSLLWPQFLGYSKRPMNAERIR